MTRAAKDQREISDRPVQQDQLDRRDQSDHKAMWVHRDQEVFQVQPDQLDQLVLQVHRV